MWRRLRRSLRRGGTGCCRTCCSPLLGVRGDAPVPLCRGLGRPCRTCLGGRSVAGLVGCRGVVGVGMGGMSRLRGCMRIGVWRGV